MRNCKLLHGCGLLLLTAVATLPVHDCMAAWSFTYSWAASLVNFAALEKRNASVFNYNVSGAVSSYCDANYQRYRNTYCKHNLNLQVGQTAELTICPNVSKGTAPKVSFGVLPWGHFGFRCGGVDYGGWAPVFATLDNSTAVYGIYGVDSYSYARPFETIVGNVGSGMWDYSVGSSETIKVSCIRSSQSYNYVLGNITEYEYEISDTCGRYKKVTIDVYDDEEAFKAWASAGITLYASLMDKNGGTHDNVVAYTVTEQLYWTDEGKRPDNDDFATAATVMGASGTVSGTNGGATTQSGEPLLSTSPNVAKTVWWKWSAPFSGLVRFDTIGTSFDAVMGVYAGTSLSALSVVAEGDDGAAGQASRCEFDCVGGKTYYICVGSGRSGSGSISLNWNLTASQPDLQVTTLTVSSTEVKVSQALTVNYTVKNAGNAAAPSSTVYVYDGSMLVASATKTGVLAAGGTYSGTYAFAAGTLAPGTHDIKVKADGGGNVSESNENNNAKTVSVSVRDPNAPTKVTASDGTSADGVQVSWTTASGGTSCNLYRSTTTVRPTLPLRSAVMSPCDDATATPGVKYYYWVEAIHSAGSSFSTFDTGYRAVSLSLGKSEDSYGQAGGNGSVPVLANTSWSASSDADWITLEAKAGNGDGILTYAVFANISQSARAGSVTVVVGLDTSHPVKKTISVTQEGMSTDFTVVDGVLKSYGGSGGVVTIPSGITSIGSGAFVDCRGLKSVTIPEGVTSIGYQAFDGCPILTSVTIPQGVMSIGVDAFRNCPMLTSVSIPSSVTSIGKTAFLGCSSLGAITVADGNRAYGSVDGILYDGNMSTLIACPAGKIGSVVIPSSVTGIEDAAFFNCRKLTSVTIPSGVASIGSSVFYGCSGLTSVTIPSSVTSIADNAFGDCQIAVVYVTDAPQECVKRCFGDQMWYQKVGTQINYEWTCSPENGGAVITGVRPAFGDISVPSICDGLPVTGIGDYAFQDCRGLTSVTIPPSVTVVDNGAFSGCSGLADADGFVIVRSTLFDYFGEASSVTIPSNVTSIGKYAFYGRGRLRTVTISEGVTDIGDYAFQKCDELTGVTIPPSVLRIGNCAFAQCKWLTRLSISEGLASIGNYAFQGCSGLRTMTIPPSVTNIGNQAFYYCGSLRTVYVRAGDAERVSSLYPFAANVQFVDLVPKTFSVSYEAGIYGSGMAETATKTEGEPLTLRGVTFTRTGYLQTAWSKNQDGSTRDYGLGASYASDAAVTLYPYWTHDTAYELLFLPGEGNGAVHVSSAEFGCVHNLPPCMFMPPAGKCFAGWACSNGKRYDDGMLVFNLTKPGETVTMTAIWELAEIR